MPTWGAARPTPQASYIVSNISEIRVFSRGVISFTSLHCLVNTSSPITLICLNAIVLSPYLYKNLCSCFYPVKKDSSG